ncbi:MAG: hypothetical protein ACI9HY_000036 [Planctomycetaceae bacterium]|jgi:hypothetical protein
MRKLLCFLFILIVQPASANGEIQVFNTEYANSLALFAMLSSNAYVNKTQRTRFPVEQLGWKKVYPDGSPVPDDKNSYTPKTWLGDIFSSLQFDIWEHQISNDTIIAFKGTDEKWDWTAGNLAIGVSIQYKSAKKHVKKYRDLNPDRNIMLTGHSLGGGLALSVSVWEGIHAYVFNTSPRIFDGIKNHSEPAIRKTLFQDREVLQALRKVYPKFLEKMSNDDIIKANFDYGESGGKHRADLLAEGLLRCSDSPDLVKIATQISTKVQCYF